MGVTKSYESQIVEIAEKMRAMEQLLIDQRIKGNSLSSQLSAAQDRIGGAERRAQQLQTENKAIKSELKYWNDLYEQDVAIENVGENSAEVDSSPRIKLSVAPDGAVMPSSSEIAAASANVGTTIPNHPPWSLPLLSSTVGGTNVTMTPHMRSFDVPSSNVGLDVSPLLPMQQRSRRESFGSIFAGSSGTGGNGNGNVGVGGVTPLAMPTVVAG